MATATSAHLSIFMGDPSPLGLRLGAVQGLLRAYGAGACLPRHGHGLRAAWLRLLGRAVVAGQIRARRGRGGSTLAE